MCLSRGFRLLEFTSLKLKLAPRIVRNVPFEIEDFSNFARREKQSIIEKLAVLLNVTLQFRILAI